MSKPLRMPRSLWIQPNEEDEALGDNCSPTKCMLALCLRRRFTNASYISVNPNRVTITIDRMYYHYALPNKALEAIVNFDDKKHTEIRKEGVGLTLIDTRFSDYDGTPEARERHRLNSAIRRADPDYVRPDSSQTIRGKLAAARRRRREKEKVAKVIETHSA